MENNGTRRILLYIMKKHIIFELVLNSLRSVRVSLLFKCYTNTFLHKNKVGTCEILTYLKKDFHLEDTGTVKFPGVGIPGPV